MENQGVLKYRKQITISATGMVEAAVYVDHSKRIGERCCGQTFFYSMFDSPEVRFIKAHKWADERIELCKKYEAGNIQF